MRATILFNATILNGTGSEPRPDGWVVVEDERIKEVGYACLGMRPMSANMIDCRGLTLLPGLIDGHVHIGAVEADLAEQQRRLPTSTLVIRTLKVLKETLDQGFTTVRDCGGADAGFRHAVADGLVEGSRMFICGEVLSQTGGHGDWRLPAETGPAARHAAGVRSCVCDGVTAVRQAAREQIRQGADFIKVMASGGAASPCDELDTSQYSLEELEAAVFEAESAGKYVAAHCYSDRGIKLCCQAGVRTIEHGNLMTDESARTMRDSGVFLVPTLAVYHLVARMGKDLGLPDGFIRKARQALDRAESSLATALAHGVRIGSGSDLLGPMQIQKGLELELQGRIMGAMGAMVAATRTNAEILGQSDCLGTVEPGKLADLLLVRGDPLKDLRLFRNFQENLVLIIQGGRIHKNLLG
jgi:imidazolonepropionase-like amidohydrolase